MVEVVVTNEFRIWYEALTDTDAAAVYMHVGLLEASGVALGHPYSSAIKGTKYAMRELRIRSGRKQLRVFYAFDPTRNAVLLLGGDKTSGKKFYQDLVPRAEKLWKEYLEEYGRKK